MRPLDGTDLGRPPAVSSVSGNDRLSREPTKHRPRYLSVTFPDRSACDMPESTIEDKPKKQFLGLSGTQTIGSALAAVTSAFVGSFLGVAGTLIGAALGSLIATVGAALYARTLSSAAILASTKIPQRRRRGPAVEDGDMLAASPPAESDEPRAKRVWMQFTPTTWIKVGAVSAAAFVIAMVGVTAVEFGTNQPISSLVSSASSIDGGATGHTTTLGKALSGNPSAPDETDKPAEDMKEVPVQVEEGTTEDRNLPADGTPSGVDSGPAGTEEPGADEPSVTLPPDLTPETEQSLEPAPAPEPTADPEVLSDSGSAEQPAP